MRSFQFLLILACLATTAEATEPPHDNTVEKQPGTEAWKSDGLTPVLKEGDRVESDELLLVTHAARPYSNGVESEELNRLIESFLQRGLPVIYLVGTLDPEFLKMQWPKFRPTYLYVSSGGQIKLRFKSKNIHIAGGFFELCGSNTVRDSLISTGRENDEKTGPARITYEPDSVFLNTHEQVLKRKLDSMSDEQILRYLSKGLFAGGRIGDEFGCKFGLGLATFNEYTFEILRDGNPIGSFGTGSRKVSLDFPTKSISERIAAQNLKTTEVSSNSVCQAKLDSEVVNLVQIALLKAVAAASQSSAAPKKQE